ncbi:extracellular dioxygenase [Apiospora marii]|uniref:Extracellular dioxygenase n=1 Tax=Apiospora marii TaxID=335849 RepID=A0ABR1RF89_9PEZI
MRTNMIRAMSGCANSPPVLARQQRAAARRSETARQLRETRGIFRDSRPAAPAEKRDEADLKKLAAKSHKVDAQYDPSTSPDIIFAGNASCALVAETTIGPYFVSGELMRTNVTEGQKGVPLHLDIQFISTSTCSPVKDMVIDVWHSNATGVYSGVSATGQGGLGSNFCRGVQVTDADGVVEFDTVFPSHYTGRANHVHILSTKDAKVLRSGEASAAAAATYEGGVATHIGQLFFDRDLVSAVEATEPYKSNQQQFVDLLEDGIAEAAATSDYDVLMDYQMLGDSLADGLLAWITVGVDVSANYNDQAPPAAHFTGNANAVDGSNSSPTTSALGAPGSVFTTEHRIVRLGKFKTT